MTVERDPDQIMAAWLDEGPTRLPGATSRAIGVATRATEQRRPRWTQKRNPWMVPASRVAVAIAVVALVVGGALLLSRGLPDSGTTPATSSPSQRIEWTPSALARDWPGPLRAEPGGGPGVLVDRSLVDPAGDVGAADPWIDITGVSLPSGPSAIGLDVASGLPRIPNPATAWIAYGVVLDLDRDGVADQRIGIDNSVPDHREWVTDLASGRTQVNLSGEFGAFGAFDTRIETWFVDPSGSARLVIKRSPPGIRFYLWASLIRDGRVVATDFAPDAGWMESQ